MDSGSVSELKHVLYVDRVYQALAEFRRRDANDSNVRGKLCDLRLEEYRVFSQNGEDGVLDALVRHLNSPTHFVEFGVENGWSCNCRFLAEVRDWNGLFIESDAEEFERLANRYRLSKQIHCINTFVTAENINSVLAAVNTPERFGVLSIDVDGDDYWIWAAVETRYRPDIVVIEFNAEHPENAHAVPSKVVDGSTPPGSLWGASIGAITELARRKGYELVHIEMARVNAFFVASELLSRLSLTGRTSDGSPNYGLRGRGLDVADGVTAVAKE